MRRAIDLNNIMETNDSSEKTACENRLSLAALYQPAALIACVDKQCTVFSLTARLDFLTMCSVVIYLLSLIWTIWTNSMS